jgi:hypothetical protein
MAISVGGSQNLGGSGGGDQRRMLPPGFPSQKLAPSPYQGFQHPPLYDPGRGHNLPLVPDLPSSRVGLFKILENGIKDDYLICEGFDPNTDDFLRKVSVAKPYLLQRKPFDGKEGKVGSVDVSYEYVDGANGSLRIVRAVLTGDYPVTEHQRVTPHYAKDDIVLVVKCAKKPPGEQWKDENGREIEWIDLNFGARAWARVLFGSLTSL